jgi:NAD(P)-dependent dehydrogenase (short-subunit alcohol dehydrogenase family)
LFTEEEGIMARALVTGCSTGIGRATAVELTKRGFEVVATARRPEVLEDLDLADRLRLDVDDEASVSECLAKVGEVDVLVNNAGVGIHAPVEKGPVDEVRKILETNVLGAVRMIQAVVPQMRERGSGTIVNVSSIAGRVSAPLGGFYSASKYALEAISEALHYEIGHWGVKVRIVEPGAFDTSFGDNRRIFAVDEPPYDELDEVWEKAQGRLQGEAGTRPGPEVVAQTIADAAEGKEDKLRWPVGDDAKLVLDVRTSMNDEDFEATMRQTLELDW